MVTSRPTTWNAALSRRRALSGAVGALTGLAASKLAGAQEESSTETDIEAGEDVLTMFVQTAQAGSFVPKPGEEGVYQVTLHGASAQTIYFSDRPHRIVGSVSTADFLAALGFAEENPPNAAIVTQTESENEDVLIVELLNPRYDSFNQTLTYDVIVLDEYQGDGFGELAQRQYDGTLPERFGYTSLFIDDCEPITQCVNEVNSNRGFQRWSAPIPHGPYKQRAQRFKGALHCVPQLPVTSKDQLAALCTEAYPDDCPKTPLWYACDPR